MYPIDAVPHIACIQGRNVAGKMGRRFDFFDKCP